MGLAVRAGSSLALEQWEATAYEISSDNDAENESANPASGWAGMHCSGNSASVWAICACKYRVHRLA
jgi:hypothetical protein